MFAYLVWLVRGPSLEYTFETNKNSLIPQKNKCQSVSQYFPNKFLISHFPLLIAISS